MKFLEYLPRVRTNIVGMLGFGLIGAMRRMGGSFPEFGLGFMEGMGAGIIVQATLNAGTRLYNGFKGVPDHPKPLSSHEVDVLVPLVATTAALSVYMIVKMDNETQPDPKDPRKTIPAPMYSYVDYIFRGLAGAAGGLIGQSAWVAAERAGEHSRGEHRPKTH